jgi:hypothetical protein
VEPPLKTLPNRIDVRIQLQLILDGKHHAFLSYANPWRPIEPPILYFFPKQTRSAVNNLAHSLLQKTVIRKTKLAAGRFIRILLYAEFSNICRLTSVQLNDNREERFQPFIDI